VDDWSELAGELAKMTYSGGYGRSPAQAIYLFDQRMAHTGIRYHAELEEARAQSIFVIRVPLESAAVVSAILAQLGKG
jgi:hypothetical protein